MRTPFSPTEHKPRGDWNTIRTLLPYLLEFKGRATLALAKLANVAVPLVLKEIAEAIKMNH